MSQYWIVDGERRYDDIDELCSFLFDEENYYDDDDGINDWINEIYYDQRVTIAGEEFYPSDIVRNCSDDLYEDLKRDYAQDRSNSDIEDYQGEIESMENGEDAWYNGCHVVCYFDDDDEEDEEDEDEEVAEPSFTEDFIQDLVTNFQKL